MNQGTMSALRPRLPAILVAALCLPPLARTATSTKPVNAPAAKAALEAGPAVNWTFPVFTDKEGYRMLTCRGTVAKAQDVNRIDVEEFSAVVFSGDAREAVDTVLLSPQATFFPKQNRATGSGPVRLVHDDVEVVGRGWNYDHAAKRVTLAHDVRVTFKAQLNDILK